MALSSSNYAADAYVTAANPAPGRIETTQYPVRSGTQWEYAQLTKSDGGIGLNVYVAGGVGPSGVIPVSQTNPTSISLSGVTIGGVITVTSSLADPVWVTGSVYVLNPSSGSSGITGTITASITGVVAVSQTNVQTTQSVYILQQPLGVTGAVGISGTASVRVESFGAPLEVFGGVTVSGSVTSTISGTVAVSQTNVPLTQSVYVVNQTSGSVTVSGTASVSVTNFPPVVTVSGTGAFDVTVLNLPVTQSVFVVNQQSSSITGTVTVSGTGVFQVTGSVYVLNPSSASLVISGALDVTSSQANPVWVTGNLGTGGGTTVIFAASEPSPSASVVTVVPQTSSVVMLMTASDRLGYTIFNTSSAALSLFFGPATGTASYFLVPGAVYEAQDIVFIGSVYGKWSADGAGAAIVTQYYGNTSGSASVTVDIGNWPLTQSVYVVNQQSASLSGVNVVSGALQITGTVSIAGFSGTVSSQQAGAWTVQTSGTTTAAQGGAWSVQVSSTTGAPVYVATTGSMLVNTGTFPTVTVNAHAVTQGGAWNTNVTGVVGIVQSGALTTQVSGTVTANQGGAWGVQISGAWSGTSVPVTSSVSFPVYVQVTGALPVASHAVTQGGAWNSAVSGIVGVTNSGAFSTFVSGIVGVTNSGAFSTFVSGVVGILQSGALAAQVSGTVTSQQGAAWSVQVSSTTGAPVYVATTGNLLVSTGAMPVVTVTSSQALPVWVTQSGGGSSVTVTNTASVTSTNANPVWVTGTVTTVGGAAGVQYGTGSTTPYTGTLMIANQGGTNVAVSASGGALLVAITGAIDTVFSGTQVVTSSEANPVWVTSSLNSPVWAALLTPTYITSSVSSPVYIQVTGALPVASHAVTQGGAWNAQVSGAWSGTSIPVTSSVSFPVYVQVTGAIPVASHAVTQGGGFTTFVSGIVGVTNSGSFSAFVSGIVGVTNSGAFATLASGAFSGADGQAGQTNTIPVTAFPETWNGSTYDRVRSSNSTQGYGMWTRNPPAATARVSGILLNPTSASLIAPANTNRMFLSLLNTSTGTSAAYVTLSSGSTILSASVRIAQNGYYEIPAFYTGPIYGITSGTGITASLGITELTV